MVVTHHEADVDRYAPRQATSPEFLVNWQEDGWQRLPARRTEVDGDYGEPLSLQWAGTSIRIAQVLESSGWHRPQPWTLRTTLLWLLPSTTIGQLPVLAKLHKGQSPTMNFERELDSSHRLVIRFWPTRYQIGALDKQPAALWIASVTIERLVHPAGLLTLAITQRDFARPTAELAKSIQSQGLGSSIMRRDATAVLLVR